MARRTKEEAEATRERILDAAEHEFERRGVSGTSLEDIARAAGVTRGAIYWHFRDKAAVFDAMMQRVTLPLEKEMGRAGEPDIADPLAQLRFATLEALRTLVDDAQARCVLEIALHKVEYVDGMQAVRERHLASIREWVARITRGFERAEAAGQLRLTVTPRTAALGLHALFHGLVSHWMLEPESFDMVGAGGELVDVFFRGLAAGD